MISNTLTFFAAVLVLATASCTTYVDHLKIRATDTTLVNPTIEEIEEVEARESGYFPDESVPEGTGDRKNQGVVDSDGNPVLDARGNPVQPNAAAAAAAAQQQPAAPQMKPRPVIKDGTIYYPPAPQQADQSGKPKYTPNIPAAPAAPSGPPALSDPQLIEELRN